MVIQIEELANAYRATERNLDPSERFAIAARQLGIRGPEAKKDARWRLVRAEIIPKSTHGGKRWSLAPKEERTVLGEYDLYLKTAERIFFDRKRYISPLPWVAEQTGYSTGAVERILRDYLGKKKLETMLEEMRDKYKDLRKRLLEGVYKKHGGDPRAAAKELGHTTYKHVIADWRRMGLSVTVDYRTIEARRAEMSNRTKAFIAVDKENATHSLYVR